MALTPQERLRLWKEAGLPGVPHGCEHLAEPQIIIPGSNIVVPETPKLVLPPQLAAKGDSSLSKDED
jgi:hypothetical protein